MWALPSRQLYLLLEMLMRTVYQANELCTRGGGSLTSSTKSSAFLTSRGRGLCCHGAVSSRGRRGVAVLGGRRLHTLPSARTLTSHVSAGFMQTEPGAHPSSTGCPRVPLSGQGPMAPWGPPPALWQPSARSPALLAAAPSWGSSGGTRGPAVSAASRHLICPTAALPPPSCGRSDGGKVKPPAAPPACLRAARRHRGSSLGREGSRTPRSPGSAPASPSRASGLMSETQIDMGKAGSLHSGF